MANLIIKSTAGNDLVIQGGDASPAITVGNTGDIAFAETVTAGTLGNAVVVKDALPTGTMVTSVMTENGAASDATLVINNTTHANHLSLNFTRKYTNSDFIIWVIGRTYRTSTSGNFKYGYTRNVGSLGTAVQAIYAVTDCDDDWISQTAVFIDTTSGTVGDDMYWGTYFDNSATGSFAYGKLFVQEFI